ncbi:MAG: class C sortase [Oscillospiraceae bacterium]|nr:class C sortase [Oscillospiraceae bacterium]
MSWWKKNSTTIILILIAVVGAGLIAYPTFADWWNGFHQTRAVNTYVSVASDLGNEKYRMMINEAERYNDALAVSGVKWNLTEEEKAEYSSVLKVTDSGMMAYIDIPKVHITLPIYHGTEEKVLQVAVGHIAGTSLPVGGAGTHCVLSGHRGLPSAKLFTDIDKLAEGDTFTITVLDRTLTYEVDQIHIVLPYELNDLSIEPDRDLCTLVTCTPYGVNTHRLLVRGHRIENAQGEVNVIADALQVEPVYIAPFIALPLLFLLFIHMLFTSSLAKRRITKLRLIEEEITS